MFEIGIFCDKDITDSERGMIEKAARSAEELFGCGFLICGGGACDDIIERAPENGQGQKDASRIMDLMKEAYRDRKKNGAVVMYTAKDLFLKEAWCFGAARIGGGVSVQSLCRLRALGDDEKQAAISRTLRHETGHLHKCASDPERRNTEKRYGMHCTSPGCTMRQSPTLKELLRLAREEDPENCLCELCRADLERFKRENYLSHEIQKR